MVKFMSKQVKLLLEKQGIAFDTYDAKSIWNEKLSANENFELIREDLKAKGVWKNDALFDFDKAEHEQTEHLKEQEEKILDEMKKVDMACVDISQFKIAKALVKALVTGNGYGGYGLILEGEGGLGKSYSVESELKELKVDYHKISGHTTALGFFCNLQKYNEKPVILIDDISLTDLKDDIFKANLKSILWKSSNDDKRLLRWTTFKTEQELNKMGFLSVFEVKPKFILICNTFPDRDIDARAIKSRCLSYKFDYAYSDKIKIMTLLARKIEYKDLTEEQRIEVVEYIRSRTGCYSLGVDLRSLVKALYLRTSMPNWKELVDTMFVTDEELKAIDDGMAEQTWCATFNKCRKTFYNRKKEIRR